MILTKGIPGLAAIAVITMILLIPQGMTQTLASHNAPTPFAGDPLHHFPNLAVEDEPNYVEDTIGDVKIKAIFHFNKEGMEEIDSFRILNQLEGYTKDSINMVQLLGGVGGDKDKLYTATDMTLARNFERTSNDYNEFDIDIYLYHRGDASAFRHFAYASCNIIDYSVLTLHDGDETFSGLTKFVLADSFSFQCRGYQSYCPACISHRETPSESTTNSLDLRETQTWEDIYKYANP